MWSPIVCYEYDKQRYNNNAVYNFHSLADTSYIASQDTPTFLVVAWGDLWLDIGISIKPAVIYKQFYDMKLVDDNTLMILCSTLCFMKCMSLTTFCNNSPLKIKKNWILDLVYGESQTSNLHEIANGWMNDAVRGVILKNFLFVRGLLVSPRNSSVRRIRFYWP